MNEAEIDKLDQYMYDLADRRFTTGEGRDIARLYYTEAIEDVLSYLRGEPYTLEHDKLALTKGNRFPETQAKTYRDIEGDLWKDDGAGYLLLVTDDGSILSLKRTRVEEDWGPLELALEIN